MKILLAEDEKALSDAEVAVLRHFGYEVDAGYDGLSAWQMAEREAYDCIVLDIMMPKMDGIEVLAKLRGSGSTVPIIMLTAKGETEDKVSGLEMGADDYIVKPFEVKELLARVHAVLRRIGDDGKPFTPHTTNPVPFVVVGYPCKLREGGKLGDIAPTMLEIMHLPQPEQMTGKSLIVK